MRFNKYAIFAVLASLLMVLSAGAVLFADQDSKADAEPEVTDKLVGIVMENNKITFKNEGNISGFEWDEENLTLTMDGVNYRSSYVTNKQNIAFTVDKNLTDAVTIIVKNENRIESVASDVMLSFSMYIQSPTKMLGDESAGGRLVLQSGTAKLVSDCIDATNTLIIENVNLNMKSGIAPNHSNCISRADNGGFVEIINCDVYATNVEGAGSSFSIQASVIKDSKITVEMKTCLLISIGMTITDNISNSIIYVRGGDVTEERTTQTHYSLGINSRGDSCTISDSIVIATAGTAINGNSFGLNVDPEREITLINSMTYFKGYDSAMSRGNLSTKEFETLSISDYDESTIVRGCTTIDGKDFTEIKSGPINLDMKQIIAKPTHTVSYQLNGGDGPAIPSKVMEFGDEITVEKCDATKHGYRFNGWTDGQHYYNPGDKIVIGFEDITLKAVWQEISPSEYNWVIIVALFALLLIIGVVMYRRDEDEE